MGAMDQPKDTPCVPWMLPRQGSFVDAIMSQRALWEVYYQPFQGALEAGPGSEGILSIRIVAIVEDRASCICSAVDVAQVAFQQCAPLTWSMAPWQDWRATGGPRELRFTILLGDVGGGVSHSLYIVVFHRIQCGHCKSLKMHLHNADPVLQV